MTYGDFAWQGLLRHERRRDRDRERPRAVTIAGEPVAWMDVGEEAWAWKLRKALPNPLNRPYLTFVLSPSGRRRRALDDYLNPVMAEMKNTPVSLWAKISEGQQGGLRIADTPPSFPPKVDRTMVIPSPGGRCEPAVIAEAVAKQRSLIGRSAVGVHISLRRLSRADFEFGGNVRLIFDGLSTVLGGDLTRPADTRITDLRVVRDSQGEDFTEVRFWQID